MWMHLSARPEGARPIEVGFGAVADAPASVTLPVLPPIRGRVLDPEGRPVAGVAVGRWLAAGGNGPGEMLPFFDGAKAVTDAKGVFEIAPTLGVRAYATKADRPVPEALCFADPGARRVAYRVFEPNEAVRPMEVTLRPTRRVRVPLKLGSVAATPGGELSSRIRFGPRGMFFLINRTTTLKDQAVAEVGGPAIEEYLPEGTYGLKVELYGERDVGRLGLADRELVVPAGEAALDLAPLEVGLATHLKLAGRPAPEIEATDLDTGRPVRLADYRGKVVVLDFWGYWCGPCTGRMPQLMELHRKFEGRPLAIVALHDHSVRSRAEYDRKIAAARRWMWDGRDLPFRVALDGPDPGRTDDDFPEGSGATVARYGVPVFPTVYVIDSNGTVVDRVSQEERLEPLVRRLVEKAEGR
jgi:thiol-disulfide isomerase/thioredoxin